MFNKINHVEISELSQTIIYFIKIFLLQSNSCHNGIVKTHVITYYILLNKIFSYRLCLILHFDKKICIKSSKIFVRRIDHTVKLQSSADNQSSSVTLNELAIKARKLMLHFSETKPISLYRHWKTTFLNITEL